MFNDWASKSCYMLLRRLLGRSVINDTLQDARGSGRDLIVKLRSFGLKDMWAELESGISRTEIKIVTA